VLLDDIDDIANVEKPEKAVRPVQNQPAGHRPITGQAVVPATDCTPSFATTAARHHVSRWASTRQAGGAGEDAVEPDIDARTRV